MTLAQATMWYSSKVSLFFNPIYPTFPLNSDWDLNSKEKGRALADVTDSSRRPLRRLLAWPL